MDRAAVAATDGQIGAVNDESWVAVDLSDDLSADADDGVAIEDRAVFRTEKIKGVLLHPYRYGNPPPPSPSSSSFPTPPLTCSPAQTLCCIERRRPDSVWLRRPAAENLVSVNHTVRKLLPEPDSKLVSQPGRR